MKALFNFITLAAIITTYFVSVALYQENNLFAAYSLVIGSIVSLILWIQHVSSQLQNVTIKVPSMKAFARLMTLPVIATVYVYSVSLYCQGNLIASYFLVLGSIASLIFWIENVSLQLQKQRA